MAQDTSNPDHVDAHFVMASVYYNSYKTMGPHADATGFRTHALRHRATDVSRLDRSAESFLINSRLERHDRETEVSIEEYFSDPGLVMLSKSGQEELDPGTSIKLPPGLDLPMDFSNVIAARRSRRAFTGDPWSLVELATVLRAAAGITGKANVPLLTGGSVDFSFRATPSGGGVYSVDLYIVALNITGLEPGIYRFVPVADVLVKVGDNDNAEQFLASSTVPDELIAIRSASAVIAMIGHSWRAMRKYGPRGLRLSFLEAGALSEHINLATTALGYASVDCASFVDAEVHEAMLLDGLYQALLHTVVVGCDG